MITGLGTDIIEVSRIQEKLERNPAFRTHVYSEAEIAYCEKQKFPYVHYAARWAVKEAYLKAIGLQFIGNHRLHEIETCHDTVGKPYIRLSGGEATRLTEPTCHIHLSISHTATYAMATVILETRTPA